MVYQRLFRSVMMLLAAGVTFAACEAEPQTPQQNYCTAKCDCSSCTPTERATCGDDLVNLEDEARGADCKDPYDTYLTCLNNNGTCADGTFDESACFNEETDLKACINPPPTCATINNGMCNEPAPAGDGTCVTGTDTKDCMPKPCPTTGNGICDEPEGTNMCDDGTDTLDCPTQMCQACFAFLQTPSAGAICAASNVKYSAFYACACESTKCAPACGGVDDVCSVGPASMGCLNCVKAFDAECTTAYNDCAADTPPP